MPDLSALRTRTKAATTVILGPHGSVWRSRKLNKQHYRFLSSVWFCLLPVPESCACRAHFSLEQLEALLVAPEQLVVPPLISVCARAAAPSPLRVPHVCAGGCTPPPPSRQRSDSPFKSHKSKTPTILVMFCPFTKDRFVRTRRLRISLSDQYAADGFVVATQHQQRLALALLPTRLRNSPKTRPQATIPRQPFLKCLDAVDVQSQPAATLLDIAATGLVLVALQSKVFSILDGVTVVFEAKQRVHNVHRNSHTGRLLVGAGATANIVEERLHQTQPLSALPDPVLRWTSPWQWDFVDNDDGMRRSYDMRCQHAVRHVPLPDVGAHRSVRVHDRLLISGTSRGPVSVWDVRKQDRTLCVLRGATDASHALLVHPDHQHKLWVGSADQHLYEFNLLSHKLAKSTKCSAKITDLTALPHGRAVMCFSKNSQQPQVVGAVVTLKAGTTKRWLVDQRCSEVESALHVRAAQNRLWMLRKDDVLCAYPIQTQRKTNMPQQLAGNLSIR